MRLPGAEASVLGLCAAEGGAHELGSRGVERAQIVERAKPDQCLGHPVRLGPELDHGLLA